MHKRWTKSEDYMERDLLGVVKNTATQRVPINESLSQHYTRCQRA